MATIRLFDCYVRKEIFLLFGVELLVCTLSSYLILLLQIDSNLANPHSVSLLLQATGYSAIMVSSLLAMGLYRNNLRGSAVEMFLRLAVSFLACLIFATSLLYIFSEITNERKKLIFLFIFSFLTITAIRGLIIFIPTSIFKRRILVLGAGESAKNILHIEHEINQYGCNIVGFVDIVGNRNVVPHDRVVTLDQTLTAFTRENGIDELVVALEERRGCIPLDDLAECRNSGIHVRDLRTFFERELGKLPLDLISPGYLVFSPAFQRKDFSESIKRLFDVLVSFIALCVVWPILLFTAIAILVESGWRSSIIYRQLRVGRAGKTFQMLKFRSMRMDAEPDQKARWAETDDPRVTRVGAFIRKHRVDELPQLINVLRGEMSFVGPRPERPEFVEQLASKIPYYKHRHAVKVGLTGWAQLCYPYGNTERDAAEKLQYDLYYIKNQSVFLDVLILLQTAEVVLFGRGAK